MAGTNIDELFSRQMKNVANLKSAYKKSHADDRAIDRNSLKQEVVLQKRTEISDRAVKAATEAMQEAAKLAALAQTLAKARTKSAIIFRARLDPDPVKDHAIAARLTGLLKYASTADLVVFLRDVADEGNSQRAIAEYALINAEFSSRQDRNDYNAEYNEIVKSLPDWGAEERQKLAKIANAKTVMDLLFTAMSRVQDIPSNDLMTIGRLGFNLDE